MIRELKKDLKTNLLTVAPSVFSESADESAAYPHTVFSLGSASYDAGLYKGFLDIDVWDRSESSEVVDNLSDAISVLLNGYHYLGTKIQYTIYLSNMFPVDSADETLRRKTIIFEIQYRRI